MYTVKMMSGESFTVSDSEFRNMANIHGNVFVPSINVWINMSSVSTMYPVSSDNGNDYKIGKLHDGTVVVRQFGQWYCQDSYRDEKGYLTVRPDPHHYPEVAIDKVPSVQEYEEKYAQLPHEERKKLMVGYENIERFLRPSEEERADAIKAEFLLENKEQFNGGEEKIWKPKSTT